MKRSVWVIAALGIVIFILNSGLGWRINVTHSIPLGLYALTEQAVSKGRYVIFCPPDTAIFQEAKRRGYLPAGFCPGGYRPVMKKVMATGGDNVAVTPSGVYVNGQLLPFSQPQLADSAGRALTKSELSGNLLKPDELLLMTDGLATSFDSRYFGLIKTDRVSVIKPLLQW